MVTVDRFMSKNHSVAPAVRLALQNAHNVNLNAAGEGDEFFDADDSLPDHMSVIDSEEFFDRYVF